MSYRSLLTILSSREDAADQIAAAETLAERFDAHLDVLALGIDQVQLGYYFAGADAVVLQSTLEQARADSAELTALAERALERSGVRWSARGAVAQFGALGELVTEVARYADLVMMPRPYGDGAPAERETMLEAVLFEAGTPVLVLPDAGLPDAFGEVACIGWNEGSEALRAVRGALPLLQRARKTGIAIIDPPVHGPDRPGPGHALCTFLDRHGVKAEIAVLPRAVPRVSEILQEHARDIAATVVVAGAYGHSRLRQAILGGVTHDLLAQGRVAVLLAH